jgi:hypothetical protein
VLNASGSHIPYLAIFRKSQPFRSTSDGLIGLFDSKRFVLNQAVAFLGHLPTSIFCLSRTTAHQRHTRSAHWFRS